MRKQAQIEGLSLISKKIGDEGGFPKPHHQWGVFMGRLRELVGENFGPVAGKEMQYDPENQDIIWEETETVGKLGLMRIAAKQEFALDPKKDLVQEFRRLLEIRAMFQQRKSELRKLILQGGGEAF